MYVQVFRSLKARKEELPAQRVVPEPRLYGQLVACLGATDVWVQGLLLLRVKGFTFRVFFWV